MAIKGVTSVPSGRTSPTCTVHQQARAVVQLSLREHEIILANSWRARKWEPFKTHDMEGTPSWTNLTPTSATSRSPKAMRRRSRT